MTKEDEPKANRGGEGKHSEDSPQFPSEEIRSGKEITVQDTRGVVVRRDDKIVFEPHKSDQLPANDLPLDKQGNVKGLPGRPFVDRADIPSRPNETRQTPPSEKLGEKVKRIFWPLGKGPFPHRETRIERLLKEEREKGSQPPNNPTGDKPKGGK